MPAAERAAGTGPPPARIALTLIPTTSFLMPLRGEYCADRLVTADRAGDQCDDLLAVRVAAAPHCDTAAMTQDDKPIGDREHVLQVVADYQHRLAMVLHPD